jgi:hypothetical protein
MVLIRANLELTPLGKLKELVYKVHAPEIRIEYADGTVKECKLVWKNLAGGGLVSELPRDLDAMSNGLLSRSTDQVRSITILAKPRWFKRSLGISFYEMSGTDQRSAPQNVVATGIHNGPSTQRLGNVQKVSSSLPR